MRVVTIKSHCKFCNTHTHRKSANNFPFDDAKANANHSKAT